MSQNATEFDSPWKDVIERYFQDFIQFFLPQAHGEIEWSRGFEFLDKELQQVVRDAELGRRLADKLVKVWLTGGDEAWVLIHLEVQSQEETNFWGSSSNGTVNNAKPSSLLDKNRRLPINSGVWNHQSSLNKRC